ncbi:MAG: hypothetical protein AAF633_11600 [Chloroflexota bacterium]
MDWLIILLIGIIIGWVLAALFEYTYRRDRQIKIVNAEYESRVAALNEDISTLQAQIDAGIASHEKELNRLKADIDKKSAALDECTSGREKDQSEVEYLRGLLDETDSKMSALEAQIASLEANAGPPADVDVEANVETSDLSMSLSAAGGIETESFTPITPELGAKLGIPEASDEERRLFDWGQFNFLDWKFGDEKLLDGQGEAGGSVDVSYRGDLVGTAPVQETGRWEQKFNVPAGFLPGFLGIFGRDAEGEATSSTRGTQAVEMGITAESIRVETESTGDDFTRFWGIGPAIQGLLHRRGFNTYAQLAEIPEADVTAVIKESKVSKSRLPENPHMVWTSQARLANDGDWEGVEAFIDTNRRDDLKLIWGIGPKIEGLLNNKNIFTFAKLSRMLSEDIDSIINEAGTRFVLSPDRLHASWIEQAHVADTEDWQEFNRIKESLSWKNVN